MRRASDSQRGVYASAAIVAFSLALALAEVGLQCDRGVAGPRHQIRPKKKKLYAVVDWPPDLPARLLSLCPPNPKQQKQPTPLPL